MENQEYVCSYDKDRKCKKPGCLETISIILAVLFFFVIGGLIGAAISATILANLAAIIVLAIVLGILLILTLIYICCKKSRKCK